jgi:hypothetical protein
MDRFTPSMLQRAWKRTFRSHERWMVKKLDSQKTSSAAKRDLHSATIIKVRILSRVNDKFQTATTTGRGVEIAGVIRVCVPAYNRRGKGLMNEQKWCVKKPLVCALAGPPTQKCDLALESKSCLNNILKEIPWWGEAWGMRERQFNSILPGHSLICKGRSKCVFHHIDRTAVLVRCGDTSRARLMGHPPIHRPHKIEHYSLSTSAQPDM